LTVKEYFIKHQDESKYIPVMTPFTFKVIPTDPTRYIFGNDFVATTLFLPLESDLVTACKKVKEENDFMKR